MEARADLRLLASPADSLRRSLEGVGGRLMVDQIVIERVGRSWAVKHNDGFLGFTKTRDEAALIAADLSEWISDQGRKVTVVLPEPRSFIDHSA